MVVYDAGNMVNGPVDASPTIVSTGATCACIILTLESGTFLRACFRTIV